MPIRKKIKYIVLVTIGVLLMILAGTLYIHRHDIARSLERSQLPLPQEYQPTPLLSPTPTPTVAAAKASPIPTKPKPSSTVTATELNLAVPFTPQAPHAIWDPVHDELCEEASVVMAMAYITKESLGNAESADQKMLAVKAFEEKKFGYFEDTTIKETETIIREHYKYNQTKIIENPTIDDIKTAINARKLVLVPAAGRLLKNPYFQPPGPPYHMFVIKGYTKDGKFIVNDPGTRRGADFVYTEQNVMDAMHDWRADHQVEKGRKAILIVG